MATIDAHGSNGDSNGSGGQGQEQEPRLVRAAVDNGDDSDEGLLSSTPTPTAATISTQPGSPLVAVENGRRDNGVGPSQSTPPPPSSAFRPSWSNTNHISAPTSPTSAATTSQQSALGRGRAPTHSSRLSTSTSMSFMSAAAISPTSPAYVAARSSAQQQQQQQQQPSSPGQGSSSSSFKNKAPARPPAGQGHRSMPSTAHSITFSDTAASANANVRSGTASGNHTDSESYFSGDDGEQRYHEGSIGQRHPGLQHSQSQQPHPGALPGNQGSASNHPGHLGITGAGQRPPGTVRRQTTQPSSSYNANQTMTSFASASGSGAGSGSGTGTSTGSKLRGPGTLAAASSTGQLRPPSMAMSNKSKLRSRSQSRMRESTAGGSSSDSDDDAPRSSRRGGADGDDSANVLPVTMQAAAAKMSDMMDDDEVERRDRGEELVRRRARERKREKKEAERRERRRKEEEVRRDRDRQTARAQKAAGDVTGQHLIGQHESMMSDMPPLATSYEERPSLSRRSTDPAGFEGHSRSQILSREPSSSTAIPYSPKRPIPPPLHTSSTLPSATPTPHSPFFPQNVQNLQLPYGPNRSASYAPSIVSRRGGTRESDVFSDLEQEEGLDRVPELQKNKQSNAAWRDEVARSMQDDDAESVDVDGPAPEDDQYSHGNNVEDEDDDDDESGEVEYTLKDRQDAINIEHPFGLPIWKPALYKKSRSVTRNAEQDLHLSPSATAERHLYPGNIAWTVAFGWWLALALSVFSAILLVVPFGGAKYSRVIWELATYLFWPFGKYVERYEEEGFEDVVKGYDELSDDDEDETVYEAAPLGGSMNDAPKDLESMGRTWTRASGRSANSSSGGTVRQQSSSENVAGSSNKPSLLDGDLIFLPADLESSNGAAVRRTSPPAGERSRLLRVDQTQKSYGTGAGSANIAQNTSSGSDTEVPDGSPRPSEQDDQHHDMSFRSQHRQFRVRALGRLAYWMVFYLLVCPIMLFVCVICWGLVFTIPMAKLLWILLRNLGKEPLALHFRSPSPHYLGNNNADVSTDGYVNSVMPHLEAGQPAPRHSKRTYDRSREMGRLLGSKSTIILCTYKAVGLKYYKYTIDGTNIVFINLLPLIAFVIVDFFVIEKYVQRHHIGGVLGFISGQAVIFVLALLSVIPLSYFIGMAVASISAQSSIGMGAVINATFGSIIEIILYSIALTQAKGQLVEGSIVGSLLAGVLLMPGFSMIGGAIRRKEQRFNARSAGVTSTMLIMAIIGILTPTLFYEIYGTFQLTCTDCPTDAPSDQFNCRRCFYEHVDPVDDPFYQTHVRALSFYCAIILVFSYLIGLWFSLRTHASHIWQNAQPAAHQPAHPATSLVTGGSAHAGSVQNVGGNLYHQTTSSSTSADINNRGLLHKRAPQNPYLASGQKPGPGVNEVSLLHGPAGTTAAQPPQTAPTPVGTPASQHVAPKSAALLQSHNQSQTGQDGRLSLPLHLPPGMTADEVNRAFQVVAATASAFQAQQQQQNQSQNRLSTPQHPGLRHAPSHLHEKEISKVTSAEEAADSHGGHDAPNWSRVKSYSVLLGCTVLYAVIAEILVDVVDVVLDGSGIPEKFLGITLFALVPNTTEFMNAISFAMNGNISLSMEIGSAYAIQVCLLQIPAMIAFTYFYGLGKDSMIHRAFTLVFPRWDALAIMFSVFLLTYTYIEARSNYYRGSILVLSYMVLLGGFYAAPGNLDNEDDPLFTLANVSGSHLSVVQHIGASLGSIFAR